MSQNHLQTIISVSAGDISGVQQFKEHFTELADLAAKAQKAMHGDQMAPEQILQQEALRTEQARLRHDELLLRQQNRQDRQQESEWRQQQQTDHRAAVGLAHLPQGMLQAVHSGGNAGGLIGGLGMLSRNPWVLGATALGATAAAMAFGDLSEPEQAYLSYMQAVSGAAPFVHDTGMASAIADPRFGLSYGYDAATMANRLGTYSKASLLGGAGLKPAEVLALERQFGITAEQSGAFASAFAVGHGAAGGPGDVSSTLAAAVATAIESGMKAAQIPEYLNALGQAVTRFSGLGIDVYHGSIISRDRALKAAGGELFEGTRGIEAIGKFSQTGMGAAGLLRSMVPQGMLQTMLAVDALGRSDGDPLQALKMLEQEAGNGATLDRAKLLAGQGGSTDMAAMLLATSGVGGAQAESIARGYGGRNGGSQPSGRSLHMLDTPLMEESLRVQAEAAGLNAKDVKQGRENWSKTLGSKQTSKDFQNTLGDWFADIMDVLFKPEMSDEKRQQELDKYKEQLRDQGPEKFFKPHERVQGAMTTPRAQPIVVVIRDETNRFHAIPLSDNVEVGHGMGSG